MATEPPAEPVSPGERSPLVAEGRSALSRAQRSLPLKPSERSEAGVLGTTKEVLGSIIDFLYFNLDFLGFPILLLGLIRIS